MDLISGLGRSLGEGNGNPLRYSCLENLTDIGAWRATVQRVAKSQTLLSTHTHTHTHTSDYTETTTYQELKRNNHKCKWKLRSRKKKRKTENRFTIYLLSAIINIRKQWYDIAKENNFQLKFLFLAALLFKNINKNKDTFRHQKHQSSQSIDTLKCMFTHSLRCIFKLFWIRVFQLEYHVTHIDSSKFSIGTFLKSKMIPVKLTLTIFYLT